MNRLKALFTRPLPQALEALPGGLFLIATFWIVTTFVLNGVLVYSLMSGKILYRWRLEWLEARESSPGFYWTYIVGLGIVVLFLDGLFAYGAWKRAGSERIAQLQD